LNSTGRQISDAFIGACFDELEAPKPGNVHDYAAGHGWTAADFRRSAKVAAPSIARPGASVGARIFGAVEATHAAIGHNTNLGIILLCAPMARAAEMKVAQMRAAIESVLASLGVQDADLAFRAIALAAPGGLGRAERHDVSAPASVTLLEAMAAAASRDAIARQYATNFADIFDLGAPLLEEALQRWARAPEAAALAVYLGFLSAFPDTHIQRKHGFEIAAAVQKEAAPLNALAQSASDPASLLREVLSFDARLKAAGLNPGASADLTVATLFAGRLARLGLPNALQSLRNND